MLKTNSKQAINNIKQYIVDNFEFPNYDDGTQAEPKTFEDIATFILHCFRSEKYGCPEDFRYYHNNEFVAFLDWCTGLPSVLDTCYYYNRSAVDDLGKILEESDTEKQRYTESQAEKRLTQLIYRELAKGAKK